MSGYYRFPTINNKQIVFTSEDDLWSVSLDNPRAIRLTANISQISTPLLSPNGKWLAYIGREDGNTEVSDQSHCMKIAIILKYRIEL